MTTQFPDHTDIIPYRVSYAERTEGLPEEAVELLQLLHPTKETPARKIVQQLEDACRRFPEIPQFKSHLLLAYKLRGSSLKARRILAQLEVQHPDYLFTRTYKLSLAKKNERSALLPKVLGPSLWLHDLYPEREEFHPSEVNSYYYCVIDQLLDENRLDEAVARHKVLILVQPDGELTFSLGIKIVEKLLQHKSAEEQARSTARTELAPKAPNKLAKKYPPTRKEPSFESPLMSDFYDYEIGDVSDDFIVAIEGVPGDILRADFEKLFADAISRFKEFAYGKEEAVMPLELALIFASLRDLTKLVPTLLDFLRAGSDIVSFWLEENVFEYSWPLLVQGFPEYAPAYLEFVKEEKVYGEGKMAVAGSVAVAASLNTDLHEQAVEWLQEVFTFYFEQPTNKNLIDTQFLNLACLGALQLNDERLSWVKTKLFENGWAMEEILGEAHANKDSSDTNRPVMLQPRKLPTSFADFVEQDEDMFPEMDEMRSEVGRMFGLNVEDPICADYYLDIVLESLNGFGPQDEMDWYDDDDEDDTPYFLPNPPHRHQRSLPVRSEKVGRNEPCPCGSGKKYKHCCSRK